VTAQQRDMVDQLLRDALFDLGGIPIALSWRPSVTPGAASERETNCTVTLSRNGRWYVRDALPSRGRRCPARDVRRRHCLFAHGSPAEYSAHDRDEQSVRAGVARQ
jgi:hypothetical protein